MFDVRRAAAATKFVKKNQQTPAHPATQSRAPRKRSMTSHKRRKNALHRERVSCPVSNVQTSWGVRSGAPSLLLHTKLKLQNDQTNDTLRRLEPCHQSCGIIECGTMGTPPYPPGCERESKPPCVREKSFVRALLRRNVRCSYLTSMPTVDTARGADFASWTTVERVRRCAQKHHPRRTNPSYRVSRHVPLPALFPSSPVRKLFALCFVAVCWAMRHMSRRASALAVKHPDIKSLQIFHQNSRLR